MKIVTVDIPVGDPGRGVYAYRVGDRVTDEVAKQWPDHVAGESSKSARAARAQTEERTAETAAAPQQEKE